MKEEFEDLQTSMKLQKHRDIVLEVAIVLCFLVWYCAMFTLNDLIDPVSTELRDILLIITTAFLLLIPCVLRIWYEVLLLYYPKFIKRVIKGYEDVTFGWNIDCGRWHFDFGPKYLFTGSWGIYKEIPDEIDSKPLKKPVLLTLVRGDEIIELEITETITKFLVNDKRLFLVKT